MTDGRTGFVYQYSSVHSCAREREMKKSRTSSNMVETLWGESRNNSIKCASNIDINAGQTLIFTARCYAERGIATAKSSYRPSVRDVDVS